VPFVCSNALFAARFIGPTARYSATAHCPRQALTQRTARGLPVCSPCGRFIAPTDGLFPIWTVRAEMAQSGLKGKSASERERLVSLFFSR